MSLLAGCGWITILVEIGPEKLTGLDFTTIASARGETPIDVALGPLLDHPTILVSGHTMREGDVRTILARPDVLVASDGTAVSPEGPRAGTLLHPRSYGTFPRVRGRYVRAHPLLSLEATVPNRRIAWDVARAPGDGQRRVDRAGWELRRCVG